MNVTPALLIILDGFGCREEISDNAIAQARTPNWDSLLAACPHTTIDASEGAVGLPALQMGNSEVGHINIGSGRVVYQDITRISRAIAAGELATNPALSGALRHAKARGGALHLLGMISDGGVHSHVEHIEGMIDEAARAGVERIYLHAFLDGRDTPPQSATTWTRAIEERFARLGRGRIASVIGRYYAMDRDNRWARVEQAWNLIVRGRGEFAAATATEAVEAAWARGETDEFVKATVIAGPGEAPVAVAPDDAVVFMNFRSDRARQLSYAFTDPAFDGFDRGDWKGAGYFCTLTRYSNKIDAPAAFPPESIRNGFGEYIASLGLKQLRIAETEKYAHVTFFFNGGVETPYAGEDRILVPSPDVATYDLKPEMSAPEVTDKLVAAIESGQYHAIVCNYANADMVGHTGNLAAAVQAIETLDGCLGRVVDAMRRQGGEVLITADHGNAEMMHDHETAQAHTAHTLNVVPLVYIGREASMVGGGALKDVAPTLLKMMGLPQPAEMTGQPLVRFPG